MEIRQYASKSRDYVRSLVKGWESTLLLLSCALKKVIVLFQASVLFLIYKIGIIITVPVSRVVGRIK